MKIFEIQLLLWFLVCEVFMNLSLLVRNFAVHKVREK